MRTLLDEFASADVEMSSYVRNTKEMARIEVLYFWEDRNRVIRKILRTNEQKEKIFYDKGIEDD